MYEWEVTDVDSGKTYRIREVNGGDISGLSAVSGVIAYILMLIGLAIGTISVAEAYPPMLIVLISLDLFALVPIVGYFIAANKRAKAAKQAAETQQQQPKRKTLDLGEAADKAVAEGLGETLSLRKYAIRFMLKYSHVMFYAALIVYWLLFAFKVEGVATTSLMILCMYGMYYFPYLLFSNAAKYKSMFLSVAGLVSIYGGVTATCVALAMLGGKLRTFSTGAVAYIYGFSDNGMPTDCSKKLHRQRRRQRSAWMEENTDYSWRFDTGNRIYIDNNLHQHEQQRLICHT